MSESDYDPTRLIRKSSSNEGGKHYSSPSEGGEETIYEPGSGTPANEDPEQTRIIRGGHEADPGAVTDDATQLVRRSSSSRKESGEVSESSEPENGPVVGWLVVVKGPGKGNSVALGYGMNSIGRDPTNRVSLSFGDERISRKKHASVSFDPIAKNYLIHPGESINLTYVSDDAVYSPAELQGGELIKFGGDTVVKFVRLCGDDFDWEDHD